jgi:hypothetical protein
MEEDALSTPDVWGAARNGLADSFGYGFSLCRIRSINVAAHRKGSACYILFGISWLD